MIDSEYSTGNYKSSKIRNGTVIRNSERQNSVLINLKLKMCKNALKKLPFAIWYILDQYKNQKMCDEAILWNSGTL